MAEKWHHKKYNITVEGIVEEIKDALQCRKQWLDLSPDTLGRAYEYHIRLECLVELLECYDCGSVGGFGKGQFKTNSDPELNLLQRAEWLIKKYSPRDKKCHH